jgi:hypothetical protein
MWNCRIVALLMMCGLFLTTALAGAYEGDASLNGVTVSGRITFRGPVPRPELLPVHRDSAVCGPTIPNEAVMVDPAGRGVAAVVVSLDGVTKGKPATREAPVVIENRGCRFFQRSNAAIIGGLLEIKNTDPVLHNTHVRKDTRSGATLINVVQPVGVRPIRKPLLEAGLLDVRCDAHPFMHASILVFDHPYFAVTDETGVFTLTQVPAGTYRLRIWHEEFGSREKTIRVPDTRPVSVDFELALEE